MQAPISHPPAPSVWKQMLHSTPSHLDMGMHGFGLAMGAGFIGYSVYELTTNKKMSTTSELGYIAGLALTVPLTAFDIQRLIFNIRAKQHHPETIQKAIDVENYHGFKKYPDSFKPWTHDTYRPFGVSVRA